MTGSRFLVALAVGSLLIAACSSGSTDDGTAAKAEPATGVPAGDTALADDVARDVVTAPASLQFTAPLVGGGDIDAATLAGKPTLFWFWAPT